MHMANLQILPAAGESTRSYNKVEPQLVEMMVPLYSHGCVNKIHKALSHHKGIYSVNVDYNEQKVTVWGICNKHQVLSTVRTKRKAACFWNNNNDHDDVSVQRHLEEEEEEEDQGRLPHPPPNLLRPCFALNKLRSLSFKLACKKVFTTARSYSFRSI